MFGGRHFPNSRILLCLFISVTVLSFFFFYSYIKKLERVGCCNGSMEEPFTAINCVTDEDKGDGIPLLTPAELEGNSLHNVTQNDIRFQKYIRKYHLTPPSLEEYNLTTYSGDILSRFNKLVFKYIIRLLKHQRNGFFIECGANDGEFLSSTLDLELYYGWTGLLIESDPSPLARLRSRNRRAWIADVCLSTTNYPTKVEMQRHKAWEGVSFQTGFRHGGSQWDVKFKAQCFPLFSILSAMNVTTVGYFAFDIEGAEIAVLKTIPFDKVIFKVISVEALHTSIEKELMEFIINKFLQLIKEEYANDLIFVHPSVKV